VSRTQETIYGVIGLILIPPVVGSFVLLKEETTIAVEQCETVRGRRGTSERIVTEDGEKLQIWPSWLGGPDPERAMRKLCEESGARVTIRGARITGLPFWQRVIFEVE